MHISVSSNLAQRSHMCMILRKPRWDVSLTHFTVNLRREEKVVGLMSFSLMIILSEIYLTVSLPPWVGIKASTEIHFSIFLIESFSQPTLPTSPLENTVQLWLMGRHPQLWMLRCTWLTRPSVDLGLSYSYIGITLQGVFYQRGRFG